jgi:hypothetical protein
MKDDHELEAALRRVMTTKARTGERDDAAAERIALRLASSPLPPQKRAFRWPSVLMDWKFEPAWPRVAALAGAAVLGITIGLSGLGTRIATDLDLVRVASADEGVFDIDSVAGLRP